MLFFLLVFFVHINSAHTHRLIKLSATLDPLAPEKELVENVHGVRRAFLDYGRNLTSRLLSSEDKDIPVFGPDVDDPKIYFIGKMLWSKGVALLMDLLKYAEDSAGLSVKIDMVSITYYLDLFH